MKVKVTIKNLLIAVISIFVIQFCQAQSINTSAITPLGTFYKTENFTLNYVVGEPLNTFIENGDLCIAQGVLQIIVNNITDVNTVELSPATVYPNPVKNKLFVDFDGNTQHLSYQLFNTNGALLSSANFNGGISNIDVSNLPKGNYALSVFEKDKLHKTFKIIKQ